MNHSTFHVLRLAFAMAMTMAVGCTHETYLVDSKHPEVEYTEAGELKWHRRFIRPEELPKLLERSGVDRKAQIDIRVPERIRSLKGPRHLLFILRSGFAHKQLQSSKFALYDLIDTFIVLIIPICIIITTGIARDDFIGTFSERINIVLADQITDFYICPIHCS